MKFKNINWVKHPEHNGIYQGFIGIQELFSINEIGKKDAPNFRLQSANPRSETFHFCTTLKYLGEFKTLELAKFQANLKWEEFTNSLLEESVISSVTNEEAVT